MKLCKDCKWMVDPGEFAKCTAPKNMQKLPTGFEQEPRWKYCTTMRGEGMLFSVTFRMCGRAGRWFEPKESEA